MKLSRSRRFSLVLAMLSSAMLFAGLCGCGSKEAGTETVAGEKAAVPVKPASVEAAEPAAKKETKAAAKSDIPPPAW